MRSVERIFVDGCARTQLLAELQLRLCGLMGGDGDGDGSGSGGGVDFSSLFRWQVVLVLVVVRAHVVGGQIALDNLDLRHRLSICIVVFF